MSHSTTRPRRRSALVVEAEHEEAKLFAARAACPNLARMIDEMDAELARLLDMSVSGSDYEEHCKTYDTLLFSRNIFADTLMRGEDITEDNAASWRDLLPGGAR